MESIKEPVSINDIPVEILAEIAVANYGECYREMLAIPSFARFAIRNRKWLYKRMTKIITGRNHRIEHYLFDKLHREDGPAEELGNGTMYWYQRGKIHREDGPASEWNTGSKFWYHWGMKHREDGPAEEWSFGCEEWYLFDKKYTENKWKEIVQSGRIEELRKLYERKK